MRAFSRVGACIAVGAILAIGVPALTVVDRGTDDRQLAADEIAAMRAGEQQRTRERAAAPALCRELSAIRTGRVADPALTELSGLVRSRRTPGHFWSIQDSGAGPVIHAIGPRGENHGSLVLTGAENYDWEDLAIGPVHRGDSAGTRSGHLYAADIGDNRRARSAVTIYRVTEPALPIGGGTQAPALALRLTYPDGPRDAETLLIDPRNGDILIATKGLTGGALYRASPPAGFAGERRLQKTGPIGLSWATGGSVSADGRTVAVRTYGSLAIWLRRGEEPLRETMRRKPCISPTTLSDGQGEAVALSTDGRTAWTVAERSRAPLLRLQPR